MFQYMYNGGPIMKLTPKVMNKSKRQIIINKETINL